MAMMHPHPKESQAEERAESAQQEAAENEPGSAGIGVV